MEQDNSRGDDRRRIGKVERLIRKYGLTGTGDDLERRWTDETSEQQSLRELAEEFNQNLMQAAMGKTGMTILDGDIQNFYRLLTADEVSIGDRTQAETTLERNGIDPDQLQQDFVSHQAIHTYLTKHRGVEPPSKPPARNSVENTQNTIQRLKSRLVSVAEKRLRSLRDANTITLGTFSVLVDIRVVCEDCGTHVGVRTLLTDGGCDCDTRS